MEFFQGIGGHGRVPLTGRADFGDVGLDRRLAARRDGDVVEFIGGGRSAIQRQKCADRQQHRQDEGVCKKVGTHDSFPGCRVTG